jgi:hypothetical protein
MDRIEKIANRVVASGMDDIYRKIESLRSGYKSTSNEALLISILRDMVSSFNRGSASKIKSLAGEMIELMKESKEG